MKFSDMLLVIPPNDAEAILIAKLAQAMGMPVFASKQTHGASLDVEKKLLPLIKKGKYEQVVVVEMPGVKTEEKMRALGIKLTIIDHHHYGELDRAHHSKTQKLLPSSLEQFLKFTHLTDKKISAFGFDPFLVRSIGYLDQGYVWELQQMGYSKAQMKQVLAFHDDLLSPLLNPKTEAKKQRAVDAAWKRRKKWKQFFVVETHADVQLRPRLSRLIVLKVGKPTSLIIIEHKRHLIYVQESDYAERLRKTFGGFTFGMDRNWGYRNEPGKKHVSLKDIQSFLLTHLAP